MPRRIAVAVSGGVDSLTAAFLLKRQGWDVAGIHFLSGYPQRDPSASDPAPSSLETADRLVKTGDVLGFPVHVIDCRRLFQKRVVDYFVRSYRRGRTPNPCMVCNPVVKFGRLLAAARGLGAEELATGHYARSLRDPEGWVRLHRGTDPAKEQSYFLGFLTQRQLRRAKFPLGEWNKTDVVRLARENGIAPVSEGESQDVGFIAGASCGDFLAAQPGDVPESGPIEDTAGRTIGVHKGLHRFTVGQRRGINCPGPKPYYVVRLDADRNRLVVGPREALFTGECPLSGVRWTTRPPRGPMRVFARIRYRSREVPATVVPTRDGEALLRFDRPQAAVTPGQAAVFYRETEVLGAGWIEPIR
jgi:tRNA-specific 2-thiouridylase